MIVNAQGILALLLAAMEFVAAGILIAVVIRALRGRSADAEPLRPLMLLLALLLATLSAVSIFVWMLLLQSYVPQWADVRCLVGVFRIGTGSEGPTGWLPTLAAATSWLRGGFLFAAGVAVVLHIVARMRPEGTLPRPHLLALGAVSLLAIAGAATETAYILIPKKEHLKPTGCCGAPASTVVQEAKPPTDAGQARKDALFYGLSAAAAVAALLFGTRYLDRWPWLVNVLLLACSAAALVAGLQFATDVVAPRRLGLPMHRCLYCLAAEAPETLVGIALLLAAPALAGWRAAARWLGGGVEVKRLETAFDRAALFCVVAGVLFFSGEWVVS